MDPEIVSSSSGGGAPCSPGESAPLHGVRALLRPQVAFDPAGVPVEFKQTPRWVAWTLRPNKDPGNKPRKVPINPRTGREAKVNTPSTWGTFTQAVAQAQVRELAGVGFVLTDGGGFVGIDLDHCREPETGAIQSWAMDVIKIMDTYTEVSQSGTGVHMFVRGKLPKGRRRHGDVEMYERDRYFAITGVRIEGTPAGVEERQGQVEAVHRKHVQQGSAAAGNGTAAKVSSALDDDELLALALRAKNGAKFQGLWSGSTAGYNSQSEANSALCCLLAFWTGRDAGQMDRLFRRSGLMRPKWDEPRGEKTYGAGVIDHAIGLTQMVFSGTPVVGSSPTGHRSILVTPGALHETVRHAEDVLLAAPTPGVFQRERVLVRVLRLPNLIDAGGIKRQAGSLLISEVDEVFLVKHLTERAIWLRPTKTGPKPIDAPIKIASTLLRSAGEWRLPPLAGVIQAPTIRPDGSVLDAPGYDPSTGLYLDTGGVDFGSIPSRPSRADALLALRVLRDLLVGFPFVEGSDRSAALAALLTALVRQVLKTAPMFVFRAPMRGTGKSLLADVVSITATGRSCAAVTQGRDDAEDQKRMLSILMEGDQVACIDNIERPLGGPDLCVVLTQEWYQGRLLGASKMIKVPTRTLWLATGNNVVIEGDLTSRVVICDLDAREEAPERRPFETDLRQHVIQRRVELVRAGLTILAAHRAAGSPKSGLNTFGRFEAWSDSVRAALVWLNCTDPLQGLARLAASDPVVSRLRGLLHQCHSRFGLNATTAAKIASVARSGNEDALAEV
ncbi:MAG: hypothetical protein ABL982_21670, partial [Vicinamibacterales bacterium]